MTGQSSNTVRALVAIAVILALTLNWWPRLDETATDYLNHAITDNLVIYASARGLNGVISVIQSIVLSVSLGAGFEVALGEILDPLNDLIERFSAFVLYALAGLGLQKMVLIASSSLVMKILVSVTLVVGYVIWFVGRTRQYWFLRLLGLLLLVRFFLIVEVGTVALLDRVYFDSQTEKAQSALTLAREQLGTLRQQYLKSASESGILSGLSNTASSFIGDGEQDGIADLTARAVVELIVIMLVRGVLLPLVFLWLVFVLGRLLLRMDMTPHPLPGRPATQ